MTTSAITNRAFAHYAETIGALHEKDRENRSLEWRQLGVMLAILVTLGGVLCL